MSDTKPEEDALFPSPTEEEKVEEDPGIPVDFEEDDDEQTPTPDEQTLTQPDEPSGNSVPPPTLEATSADDLMGKEAPSLIETATSKSLDLFEEDDVEEATEEKQVGNVNAVCNKLGSL